MTNRAKPTAVLTDDHPAVLATASTILQKDFEIVATAGDGRQALEAVTSFKPELLVLDITMPGWDGFETARRVMEAWPTTKVLFLTAHENIAFMAAAREMGASCVIKQRMRNDLLPAAREALAGELFFSELNKNSDSRSSSRYESV
jgi:DNA-binding NarL/FixJ family response regulator